MAKLNEDLIPSKQKFLEIREKVKEENLKVME